MTRDILNILQCPRCWARLQVEVAEETEREIRSGELICCGKGEHHFAICGGILHLGTGFDHELVQKEIEYENSTYHGSPHLTDPELISHFPETLSKIWPHTSNFGADFSDLIDRLDLQPRHWVLDIGTGPCWTSRLLAQRGARVIALDVNESLWYGLGTADLLFEKHRIYFERILESMTALPFVEGSIDRVTFNASFHHTPDQERTLQECYRVLRPGGLVAMVNESFGSLRHRLCRGREVTDLGSHHTVAYKCFEHEALHAGFEVHYYLADHVRRQLQRRFARAGNLLAGVLERAPLALKQLNSALIVLHKPLLVEVEQEAVVLEWQHA